MNIPFRSSQNITKPIIKTHGFTIVELLIVVVVIAILAAITIVSYNGITTRARETQQIAGLDKIGKAIQLYSAEKGHSLGSSGAGWAGEGYGGYTTNATTGGVNYREKSIDQVLRESGYLNGSIAPIDANTVLLAPCTTTANTRWVVLATVTPAPTKSVAEQITATGCNHALIASYTGGSYNRNLLKAY